MRTHVLANSTDNSIGITVNAPAGWSGDVGGWTMESLPAGFDPPNGAGIIAFVVDEEFFVYGDPCHWQSTRPDTPATTVDEIVTALANQASRNPTELDAITIDGYSGMRITLHVPDDAFRDCDDATFATLGVAGEDPALWAQGPGEVDEVWVLDVDGRVALIEGGWYASTPQRIIDELHTILNYMTLTPITP